VLDRKELRRREYTARINRVMDYVSANMDGDLSLARLAREANFSQFHFHRLFHAMVGETLSDFIRRVRLEKAASVLVNNPLKAITAIALDCGFSGSAAFCRAFRERFGCAPSVYRVRGKSKARKVQGKTGIRERKPGKAAAGVLRYSRAMKQHEPKLKMQVEVKQLPKLQVAYVRHIGPYNRIPEAFDRLKRWAGPRRLMEQPGAMVLGVYHDDPEVTETAKLRSSACVTVPPGTAVDGEVGTMTIPGGLFAVARFEIDDTEYADAWNQLMGGWMPESGYQSDDRMCYEIYRSMPDENPQHKHIIDICEPVRPL
jgi:AraC family transcriptional regulator